MTAIGYIENTSSFMRGIGLLETEIGQDYVPVVRAYQDFLGKRYRTLEEAASGQGVPYSRMKMLVALVGENEDVEYAVDVMMRNRNSIPAPAQS